MIVSAIVHHQPVVCVHVMWRITNPWLSIAQFPCLLYANWLCHVVRWKYPSKECQECYLVVRDFCRDDKQQSKSRFHKSLPWPERFIECVVSPSHRNRVLQYILKTIGTCWILLEEVLLSGLLDLLLLMVETTTVPNSHSLATLVRAHDRLISFCVSCLMVCFYFSVMRESLCMPAKSMN